MQDIQWLKEQGVDVDKGVELLGDLEMYHETLQDFLDEMETRGPQIVEYKEKKDMDNYAILVHALKSDSNYLGFSKLGEMALEHQLKSQEHDVNYVMDHYEELNREMERILQVVKSYLNVL